MAAKKKVAAKKRAPKKTPLQKQVAEMALPPASPLPQPEFMRSVMEDAKEETPSPEREGKLLLELAQTDAWKVLKEYINRKKKRLEKMTRESVRQKGSNFQDIGFSYIIYDQVASALDDVVNRVEAPMQVRSFEEDNGEEEL